MNKVVVFDLGKVLVDFDYGILARKIAARCKMALEELAFFITHEPLLYHYETGLVTTEQFYKQICAATGYCGDLEEFGLLFGDIFTPIEPMIGLNKTLRQRGVRTYIFSNTNELAVRFIRRAFPFFNEFEDYILSYEQGAMKPDARIYDAVEKRTGRRGADILYIDDRPENIAVGAARGWQVILQRTPERTLAAVEKLGFLNGEK
ncbi:MAG TPA: HAD family phosphatase [Clostridia bacterium]|nr:HAD family phosphatase [Clostridia bacterium]